MFHVCDALMAQLSILIFQYLSHVGLTVHNVLVVRLRCLQLVDPCLEGTTVSTQRPWRETHLCSSSAMTCSSALGRPSSLASPVPRYGTK
jgi:hypothetical protein